MVKWTYCLSICALLCNWPLIISTHKHFKDELQVFQEWPMRVITTQESGKEAEAAKFLQKYNEELKLHTHELELASFQFETDIKDATEKKLKDVQSKYDEWSAEQLRKIKDYINHIDAFQDEDVKRQLNLILTKTVVSNDQSKNKKVSDLLVELSRIYSTATVGEYSLEPDLEKILADSRDEKQLLFAWLGWREVTGPKMKDMFAELVNLQNEVSVECGFSDTSEVWIKADFEFLSIEQQAKQLLEETRPLYQQLHAYVRRKLRDAYSGSGLTDDGMIPAHLLGNMWAQEWTNIYDLVKPYPEVSESDVTEALQSKSVKNMFETAEEFFTSIGLFKMTDKFWKFSMKEKPKNKDVVCHAAAADLFKEDDFRIKMCTEKNEEDFITIHHEMGHIEYYMAYADQPPVYRGGANAAFHEAIGDTIALSVDTTSHYQVIGLLEENTLENDTFVDSSNKIKKSDINNLLKMALQKVAFLPFGYLIDVYRWEIFRGNIAKENYNADWWKMRTSCQGIKPPVEGRDVNMTYFDAGSKYHVAGNVPYLRYFFSFIGQFQFHKAMCDAAGYKGLIHNCDFYNSPDAGHLLRSVLELGASKSWPEAMKQLTGQEKFKSDDIKNYFEPLYDWLRKDNEKHNEEIGWKADGDCL